MRLAAQVQPGVRRSGGSGCRCQWRWAAASRTCDLVLACVGPQQNGEYATQQQSKAPVSQALSELPWEGPTQGGHPPSSSSSLLCFSPAPVLSPTQPGHAREHSRAGEPSSSGGCRVWSCPSRPTAKQRSIQGPSASLAATASAAWVRAHSERPMVPEQHWRVSSSAVSRAGPVHSTWLLQGESWRAAMADAEADADAAAGVPVLGTLARKPKRRSGPKSKTSPYVRGPANSGRQ